MKKEEYLEQLENLKISIKEKTEAIEALKESYKELNKPCNVGDNVKITLASGRVVKGEAKAFGILNDKQVYVTSYKDVSTLKYITVPYQTIEVL